MSGKCCPVTTIALILVLIGGLNWGLIGFFSFDLVNYLFVGMLEMPMIANVVYGLVGLSAVFITVKKFMCCGGSCDAK